MRSNEKYEKPHQPALMSFQSPSKMLNRHVSRAYILGDVSQLSTMIAKLSGTFYTNVNTF